MAQHTNEAFSRIKIDAQLRDEGWDVLDASRSACARSCLSRRASLGSIPSARRSISARAFRRAAASVQPIAIRQISKPKRMSV